MPTRVIEKQKPALRTQVRDQRSTFKVNPPTGIPWGQPGWPGQLLTLYVNGSGDVYVNSGSEAFATLTRSL